MQRWSSRGRRNGDAVTATSLVVLVALASAGGVSGCKKREKVAVEDDTSPSASPPAVPVGVTSPQTKPTANTVHRDSIGCFLSLPDRCDPNEHCKSPGSWQAECPPSLRHAGEPPPVRRPQGKEDWIRIRPWLLFDTMKKECAYQPEWFCSPPDRKSECTSTPPSVTVPCTRDDGAGTMDVQSFVYKEGSGACHKVPAMTCKVNERGLCDLPDGDVVPCPDAGIGRDR